MSLRDFMESKRPPCCGERVVLYESKWGLIYLIIKDNLDEECIEIRNCVTDEVLCTTHFSFAIEGHDDRQNNPPQEA